MVFSVLAFIAIVISICIPERKKSLGVQSLNCLCEELYDYTISAYTGAVLVYFSLMIAAIVSIYKYDIKKNA